jgi:uncharacterized RDD family membrane protein YckC
VSGFMQEEPRTLWYAGEALLHRPAPLPTRVGAAFRSALGIGAWCFVWLLAFATGLWQPLLHHPNPTVRHIADVCIGIWIWVVPLLLNALYAARRAGTYGMVHRRLILVNEEGRPVFGPQAFLRAVVGILLLPLVPVSVITALLTAHRRSLADLVCGTKVCQRGTPSQAQKDLGEKELG